jgi:membrane protein required for colicin V production
MLMVDWAIVVIVLISALISIKRGFVKEMLSMAIWISAFVIARIFSGHLEVLLVQWVQTPSARYGAAFGLLFAATLMVGAMINHLVSELVKATGLSGTDRLFGTVFGVVRGLILVTAAVYGLQMTPVSKDPWWLESFFIPHFELMVVWSKDILPGAAETLLTLGQASDGSS